jgi:hypothetical protein
MDQGEVDSKTHIIVWLNGWFSARALLLVDRAALP